MTPAPFTDLAAPSHQPPAVDATAALTRSLAPDSPRHRWLIRHRDGSVASDSFSPPVSHTDVQAWYPGAAVEPEPEPEPSVEPAST